MLNWWGNEWIIARVGRWIHIQLCLTLCDPMDCRPPGFSAHGTLQARILEWGPPPGALPDLRIEPVSFMSNLHWQAGSSPIAPPGKPRFTLYTLINFCLEGLPELTHAKKICKLSYTDIKISFSIRNVKFLLKLNSNQKPVFLIW